MVAPYALERGYNVLLSGLIFEMKPFIIFFGLYYVAFRAYRYGNIQNSVEFICYALMAIAILDIPFVLHDLFAGHDVFGEKLALRGEFYRPNGLLRHPVTNAQQLLFSLIAAVTMLRLRFRKWVLSVAFITFLMIIVTLQVKETIAAIFVIMTYPFLGRRFSAGMIPLAVLSLIPLAFAALLAPAENPVTAHFAASVGEDGDETVRSAMYAAAPRIAVDNFPFGSGVSSFGSEGSRMDGYSSVYKRYGIWGLWGANYSNDRYLLDTFWPKILGESGFFGLFAFVLFFLSGLFRSISRLQREKTPITYFAFLIISATLMLSSAMQPFNEELAGLMFALAFACTFCQEECVGKIVRSFRSERHFMQTSGQRKRVNARL